MEWTKGNDNHKIKVFSSDDEKLKTLGELLSNKSSRSIIRLLIENEMYANEISKKLEIQPNLVVHHLRKMESIGLLEITTRKIIQKGEEHRFFKIPPGMLVLPAKPENETNNGFLKKIFKEGIRFAAIGITSLVSWVILKPSNEIVDGWQFQSNKIIAEETVAIIVPLLIIIFGLIAERVLKFKKYEF